MQLRKTTLIIIVLTSLGLLVLLISASFIILRSSFSSLEHKVAASNVQRAKHALLSILQRIDSLTLDWASWDDTYRFIIDRNEEYIASNLTSETYQNQRLNLIVYTDVTGNVAFSKYIDPQSGEQASLPARIREAISPGARLSFSRDGNEGVKGLLLLPEGPLLLSCRPILTSSNKGPARGMLMIGRFVTDNVVAEVASMTQLDVSFIPLESPGLDLELRLRIKQSGNNDLILPLSREKLLGAVVLDDVFGNPALVVRAEMDRDIHAEGLEVMVYNLISLAVVVIVFSSVVLVLIERKVLSRVRGLAEQVDVIGKSGEASGRTHIDGADELAGLSKNINEMLAELDKSKAALNRQVQEFRDNERFLQQLLDSIQAGILLVDPLTHVVVEVNAFALRMAGLGRTDVVGKACHGLLCQAEWGRCPVTDLHQTVDLSTRMLRTARGEELPILKSVTTVERQGRSYLLETFIDISEIKKSERALRLSEETYRTIFMNSGTATVIVDAADKLILINPEFEKLVGKGRLELENRGKWTEFIHSEDLPPLLAQWANAARQSDLATGRFECRMTPALGGMRYVTMCVASIPGASNRVVSILDITGLKEAEKALLRAQFLLEETVEDRTRELQEANKTLKVMDELKSSFLSSASHELRTPLTSVLGFAKLMDKTFKKMFLPLAIGDEHLERKAREFSANFKIIQLEGERLTRLINDLLDLNKIESGRIQWRDEAVDLAELLRLAFQTIQGEFASKPEVEVFADIPAELPLVWADKDRLRQVLFNLLNNAAKFTVRGQVRLVARSVEGEEVEVRVEDSGIGVDRVELSKIFEKFYQSQGADGLSDKPVGTGLGLAICSQIVEHYGGRIWAESDPGQGSVFVVRLPTMAGA